MTAAPRRPVLGRLCTATRLQAPVARRSAGAPDALTPYVDEEAAEFREAVLSRMKEGNCGHHDHGAGQTRIAATVQASSPVLSSLAISIDTHL